MTMAVAGGAGISWWFVGAAALSAATAGIHVFAGAPEIMTPILASDLHPGIKGVVDVLWHHITALLLLTALASAVAGRRAEWRAPVAMLLGGQYVLIAVLFLGLGLHWLGSIWPLPQWVLFFAMAGLMLAGLRAGTRQAPDASPR